MATKNKIAIVTGGSRGLGRQTALTLAGKGIDVIVTYRSRKEEAAEVVGQIGKTGAKGAALPLDTGDSTTFGAFSQQLKATLKDTWVRDSFDFLINNAGIDAPSKIPDTSEEAFDELFRVHLKGVYFLTQKMLPFIADNGRIVNLSTGLTRFSTPGYAAYASMKGAIEVFTRYLAKELGSRGITANTVAPGITKTDFTRAAFEGNEHLEQYMSSQTALGRVGVPEDIGGVIAFLCTEDARWVTAQRIEASGGLFI